MRNRITFAVMVGLMCVTTLVLAAHALDQPISGVKLFLKRSPSGKERMVFVSKDPNFLFPAIGSADDPANGSPGGLLVELFSLNDSGGGLLVVPSGEGKPGWKVKDGSTKLYHFVNGKAPSGISPVRTALLRQGKRLKVIAKDAGLALTGPQGAVGLRITTGSLRSCALFGPSTVKKDQVDKFLAKGASPSSLADCSDASLGGGTGILGRPADPVVLPGAAVPSLDGISPGALVAFRYLSGWSQIPVQVDERAMINFDAVYNNSAQCSGCNITVLDYTDSGTFTGPDPNPALDPDDEIVFMARDAGARPASFSEPAGVVPGSGVEVTVTDPIGLQTAYVYLFEQMGALDQGAGRQYVDYQFVLLSGAYKATYKIDKGPNPEDSSVTTSHYMCHFSDRWIQDELRVFAGSASSAEILDRHKNLFAPDVCSRSEDTFSHAEGAFVINKSGPVRAIRSYVGANSGPLTQREHLYYERREDIATLLRVHPIQGVMDFYDYSPAATGMVYRNDLNQSGVTIDGVPDSVTAGLFGWELVTGQQGSLTHVGSVQTSIALPVTAVTSYYLDDTTPPVTQCTGDAFAYGSSGLWINTDLPNTDPRNGTADFFTAVRTIYYDAPGLSVADAEQRATWAANPLAVATRPWQ
ncbi:MAG: hypothetical protein ACE5I7_03005 [Candidatus Binatia bacterium]